jgi:DNA repair exonuclease SbcCD ATPase subunit
MKSGNNPLSIKLDSSPLTLITGKNGAGKTSVLTAILFALYGKPDRKINKPQLVNSINQKNAYVRLDFTINDNTYFIERGIRPNIFRINKNGNYLDEESSVIIDQNYLESSILKMSFKTFTQICLLSSSNFIAFFGLPAAGKRQIIDDILDISIFTEMSGILKTKIEKLKTELQTIRSNIETTEDKIQFQKDTLFALEKKLQESQNEKQQTVDNMLKVVDEKTALLKFKQSEIEKTKQKTENQHPVILQRQQTANEQVRSTMQSIKDVVKTIKFFNSHDTCPTCAQEISETKKEQHRNNIQSTIKELNQKLEIYKDQQNTVNKEYELLQNEFDILNKKQKEISLIQNELNSILQHIRFIEKDINELNSDRNVLYNHKNELIKNISENEKDKTEFQKRKEELNSDLLHYYFINDMLKDDGIKTKVIKYYLPIINSLMEKYLDLFSFFISFNLDENFNEIIKERHYSQFSYDSFSEGEKSRLNLAMLFTFRELIKIKNTAKINLLFLDEIFQSSLDEYGKNVLMEVLFNLSSNGENIFVITHDREIMNDTEYPFSRILQFEVKDNFSSFTEMVDS